MDEKFRTLLAELEAGIATLPADRQAALRPLLEETKRRHEQIRLAVAAAREALDDWRLAMKYMVFDQEARLRESRR